MYGNPSAYSIEYIIPLISEEIMFHMVTNAPTSTSSKEDILKYLACVFQTAKTQAHDVSFRRYSTDKEKIGCYCTVLRTIFKESRKPHDGLDKLVEALTQTYCWDDIGVFHDFAIRYDIGVSSEDIKRALTMDIKEMGDAVYVDMGIQNMNMRNDNLNACIKEMSRIDRELDTTMSELLDLLQK